MKKLTVCLSLLLSIGLWGPAPVSAGGCGCGSVCVNDPCNAAAGCPGDCGMSPPTCQYGGSSCEGAPSCTEGDCPTGMGSCSQCMLCWCGGDGCLMIACTCGGSHACVCGGTGCTGRCPLVWPYAGMSTPCGGKGCLCGRPRCVGTAANTCNGYCKNADPKYCDNPTEPGSCCGCNNSPCCKGTWCADFGADGCPTCCDNRCGNGNAGQCGVPTQTCNCNHTSCCAPGNNGCFRCNCGGILGCDRCNESRASNCNASNPDCCFCDPLRGLCADPFCPV